ncbi:beta-1,6-galactosyltransferase GALT29A-like [Rutidosis leptorrhynchoides]|uniref:beta-1,6-galactosyltransferase GALT29A-like n=1 Tax=Rutidosis leptorrhynchoides TaxID=125765 RepID=UPI003A98FD58
MTTPPIHTFFRSRSKQAMIIKRSIRPLFSVIFVFAAAAVTLCFRLILSGAAGAPFVIHNVSTAFNESILTFSAIDLADDSLRQNVEQLVDGDVLTFKGNRQRSFLSAGRYRLEIGSRSVRGGPVDLRLPEIHQLRLQFRRFLRDWWRQRRFDYDVMLNMVNVLKTLKVNPEKKYRTCAVVGNSGILLKGNQGEVIDKHEFVIRLNNARIGGYERFVGSKTSLSFMNSNILHLCSRRGGCFCHPYGENVPIMMYMSQPVHFLDYAVCNSSHKAPLTITDPRLDVLCARIVKYYSVNRYLRETGKPLESWSGSHGGTEFHYSSGMQAIMFALGVCDQVDIFGFGKSDSAKHHYHTNQKNELSLHDYQAEYDLYEDLVKNPEVVPFISDKFKFPLVVIHR